MKINSGKFRGFPILTKPIAGTRPTSDKVKQAIFNILGEAVRDRVVLDLFSGFGGLGLEALSRGAKDVFFVEKNPRCAALIRQNVAKTGAGAQAHILVQDIFQAIGQMEKRGFQCDIVLSDAPYQLLDTNAKLLNVLENSSMLKNSSLVLFQHDKGDVVDAAGTALKKIRAYSYGDTIITIYQKD